jgi:hypothetical protein
MSRLAATSSAAFLVVGGVVAGLFPADARPTAESRCDPGLQVAARGATLRADLDGDRRADRVWLTGRRTAPNDCQFTVVVAGAGGWAAKRTIVPRKYTDKAPRLVVLAAIDGTRGAEVVIEREEQSNFGFALVLTVRSRRLVTLPAPRNPFNVGDVFTYSASDAPGGAWQVDCPKPGTVVTSGFRWLSTGPDPYGDPHYYAERRTYRVTGVSFRQLEATVLPNATQDEADALVMPSNDYLAPFESCAVTHFLF